MLRLFLLIVSCPTWVLQTLIVAVCNWSVWFNHRWLPFCVSRSSGVLARWSSRTATSRPCLSKRVRRNLIPSYHTRRERKERQTHAHCPFILWEEQAGTSLCIRHFFFWSACKFEGAMVTLLLQIMFNGSLGTERPWLYCRPVRLFLLFYSYVHEAGGLCILDEVQTGFGRAGNYFWIFESQGM